MILADFACAYCGEMNEITVDPLTKGNQQMTEDCQVCCRPNSVSISWQDTEEDQAEPLLTAKPEANLEE